VFFVTYGNIFLDIYFPLIVLFNGSSALLKHSENDVDRLLRLQNTARKIIVLRVENGM